MVRASFPSTLPPHTSPECMDKARACGLTPGFADIATAATASRNDVTLLTRNVRHSQPFGIIVANPFETVPVL
jgi:toxin FitB